MDPLDISDLLPSQGFLPSSSDEEDDISSRNNKHLGNRLASIFGVPAPPKEEQDPPKISTSVPIFSCSCELETEKEGQHISEGPVGLSVIGSNDGQKYCFLVYGAQKEPKAVYVLAPEQFILKINNDYLQLTNQKHNIRLKFESTTRETLGTLAAIYLLLCAPRDPDTFIPSGDTEKTCEAGSAILYETHTVTIGEAGLQISEKISNKAKVGNKEHHETYIFVGLHRGDIIIQPINSKSVRILQLKKMKSSTTKLEARENTPTVTNDTIDQILEPQVKEQISVSNIAVDETEHKCLPPQEEPVESNLQHSRCSSTLEQYEAFHRIVGIEMDRLQIRLQDSFAKTLEATMAPIRDEIKSIKLKQEELLKEMNSPR